ncbi:hypothetical protein AgCh_017042 [Apium graveolens]
MLSRVEAGISMYSNDPVVAKSPDPVPRQKEIMPRFTQQLKRGANLPCLDEMRLQKLRDQAIELKVDDCMELYKNVTYRDLVQVLGAAVAGLHAMTDEHFGISIVEYMAAGAIPIGSFFPSTSFYNSAGPKMDIISPEDGKQIGFLAQRVEEYTDAILQILRMPESERLEMADAARQRASRDSMDIIK